MKAKREKVVAVAFDLNFRQAAEIFQGISEHVNDARLDWRLLPLSFGFEQTVADLAASGRLAGVMGSFVSDRWIAGLRSRGIAAVNLFRLSDIRSIPTVCIDDSAMGRAAAAHLTKQGVARFIFYSADRIHSTRLRQAGFQSAVGERPLTSLRAGPALGQQLAQLCALPSPVGAFCNSDALARNLINEARRQKRRVGRDFLVLGSDNDPAASIFAGVGISSFQLPTRAIGTLAAQLLERQLDNLSLEDPTCHAKAATLIARESSLAPGAARLAQTAVNYMQERLDDPTLDIEKLARALGASRRSLELAFENQFHTSPYKKLCNYRLEKARHLLASSTLPIESVGQRCGYPEPHHFSAWFKKQAGQAPKFYRSASRARGDVA